MPQISIAGRDVGTLSPPFVIAEAGINHNGDLGNAVEMVRAAKAAGADAVKFQTFCAEEFVSDRTLTFTYQSQGRTVTEPMVDMFKRYEFTLEQWRAIREACDAADIIFLSTPQNRRDLDLLLDVGLPAVKVGSDDFTNLPLLRSYRTVGLPLILSCGMADLAEVHISLSTAGAFDGHPVCLLLCTSEYPTPPAHVHLRKLTTLAAAFPEIVLGFSDHTQGALSAPMALALGARVFEKHFTLDHNLPGPDHWFSEDPAGLTTWVQSIRTGYMMLGSASVRPTANESENRKTFRRSLVAAYAIAEGEEFTEENVAMLRHKDGKLTVSQFDLLIGRRAHRSFAQGEPLDL